ncbi:MAG: LLM class flavin-dependent oxidoreductase [Caldilineaceae bacterium]|nr:LLM class flavin-dependent oxidoreductase [Caldilineaceae bacterium]
MAVSVGLNIWSGLVGDTIPYLDAVAAPFASLWFPDHVQYDSKPVAEGWSLLSFALARYPDKVCGHQVLCNSFRNPAHLAKMVATCQILSGGRVVLGIGAGWNEEEYLAYDWPFPKVSVRAGQLAEAIQICRAMWSQSPASFQGKHYQIANAYCHPHPDPLPPVMVGGAGEKFILRVVAQHADWWNYIYQDQATYAQKQDVLKEHCRVIGRDYETIVQVTASNLLVAETEAAVKKLVEAPHVRPVGGNGFAGTPAQVTERLLTAVAQGAKQINVSFSDTPRLDSTQLFIEEVLPHLAR